MIAQTYAGNAAVTVAMLGPNGDGGQATSATFTSTKGVSNNAGTYIFSAWKHPTADYVLVSDAGAGKVRKISTTTGIITTWGGNGVTSVALGNGQLVTSTSVSLVKPWGFQADTSGNIYVTAFKEHNIRKVAVNGIIGAFAGIPGQIITSAPSYYLGDGQKATAFRLTGPNTVIIDTSGQFFFAEFDNHRVRTVNSNGILGTYVGTGVIGSDQNYFNGPRTTVSIPQPYTMYLDTTGNWFISQSSTGRIHKLVVATGEMTLYSGINGE